LLKNERYNYLSPLKNMLKSKHQKISMLENQNPIKQIENNDTIMKSSKAANATKFIEENSHTHQRKKYRTHKKRENKSDTESENNSEKDRAFAKTRTDKNQKNDPIRRNSKTLDPNLTKAKVHEKKDQNLNETSKEIVDGDKSRRKSKTLKAGTRKSCTNHKKSFNTIAKASKIDNVEHLSTKSKIKTRKKIHVTSRLGTTQPNVKLKSTRDSSIRHRRSKTKKTIKLPTETVQSKVSKYLNDTNNSRSFSKENLTNIDKDMIDLSSSSSSSFVTLKKSKEKTVNTKSNRVNTNALEVSQTNSNFDMTFNMTSMLSMNKSLNNTSTNKLDTKTKKKLISNAIEKSKTLKAPSIKAPTLLSPTTTSTAQKAHASSNVSMSVVRAIKKSQDNDSILNTSNASFLNNSRNFSVNNNTTLTFNKSNGYKFIEPPCHPPPPPPLNMMHLKKNELNHKKEEASLFFISFKYRFTIFHILLI
jgi:hypothetical protein